MTADPFAPIVEWLQSRGWRLTGPAADGLPLLVDHCESGIAEIHRTHDVATAAFYELLRLQRRYLFAHSSPSSASPAAPALPLLPDPLPELTAEEQEALGGVGHEH